MKTIKKWFWAWDFDKEEQWLNDMAAKGLAMVDHTGIIGYQFEECAPDEYIYRLELLEDDPQSEKGQEYVAFLEETGAEKIGQYMRWCYFRRKAELGGFDLFSDFDSRMKHISRVQGLVLLVMLLESPQGIHIISAEFGSVQFWGSTVCLCLSILCAIGWLALQRKKMRLARERKISEN